ncbi:hypothetical protein [Novosphingobium sp. Leaf2]|uniref:hypothetical protein n=1 Tax=Novosphingobium sp. Leaf2 TaxID=1735670 RepID=UPI0006FBBAC2|nr:hypothetical protein [Novosphingobium sp. Leaf2]KQM14787.1 hypothetical protein ASE49_11545 [Novosphingobium sp. Leaf2]
MQDIPSPVPAALPRKRSVAPTLIVALIAFILGAALTGWIAVRGYLPTMLGALSVPSVETATPAPTAPPSVAAQLQQIGTVEGRLAMIEDRLSRIDPQARAAASNAGRAEALLVAASARRLVERGEPLGPVADQLRLRFADAQPRAVQTVIDFAAKPVTLDDLSSRLEALSPELTVTGKDANLWDRIRHEVSSMFVVRRDSSTLSAPSTRIERVRLMLIAGRIDAAIDELGRLPGADAADRLITDARRYEAAQKALDLLETAAMLEPSRLQDASGQPIVEPSTLEPAAPQDEPTQDAAQ